MEDLRTILDIEKTEYPKYANLKQKVLNSAMKEINANTDISFEFEEIKTGRKVTSLKFYINANRTKNKVLDEVCATKEGKNVPMKKKNTIQSL